MTSQGAELLAALGSPSTVQDLLVEDGCVSFTYVCGSCTLPVSMYGPTRLAAGKPYSLSAFVGDDDAAPYTGPSLAGVVQSVLTALEARQRQRRKANLAVSSASDGGAEAAPELDCDMEQPLDIKDIPDLVTDLELYRRHMGDKVTAEVVHGTVVVTMDVSAHEVLEPRAMVAWGLDPGKPVLVQMVVAFSYRDGAAPRAQVLNGFPRNSVDKSKFELKFQLESIVNSYVSKTWPRSAKQILVSAAKPSHPHNCDDVEQTRPKLVETKESDASAVDELVGMGFDKDLAVSALALTEGQVDAAAQLLIDSPEAVLKVAGTAAKTKGAAPTKVAPALSRSGSAVKPQQPKDDRGYLLRLVDYLRSRLPTLNGFCVICDSPHMFGNMLKPAVCMRDLCVWSFQELGVAAGSTDSVETSSSVIELLVDMARAAALSGRKEVIFDPFPTLLDPSDQKRKVLDPGKKDWSQVKQLFESLPAIAALASRCQSFMDLKKALDSVSLFEYPLLLWIINSNRSHIVKLPGQLKLSGMQTDEQYLMLSAPPEKEKKFRELKKAHGSVYAFHGSPVENWHSIVRNGLRNASGTKLQINGAAYGNGIYMSPSAQMAFGYSQFRGGATDFLCCALVEVINTNDIRKSGDIWVVPDESHVCTRLFFVYKNARTLPSITAQALAGPIQAAMSYYRSFD